jgi:hypothetical protein
VYAYRLNLQTINHQPDMTPFENSWSRSKASGSPLTSQPALAQLEKLLSTQPQILAQNRQTAPTKIAEKTAGLSPYEQKIYYAYRREQKTVLTGGNVDHLRPALSRTAARSFVLLNRLTVNFTAQQYKLTQAQALTAIAAKQYSAETSPSQDVRRAAQLGSALFNEAYRVDYQKQAPNPKIQQEIDALLARTTQYSAALNINP